MNKKIQIALLVAVILICIAIITRFVIGIGISAHKVSLVKSLPGTPEVVQDAKEATTLAAASSSETADTEVRAGADAFTSGPHDSSYSNVVGYFGYGSFFWYVPDWLEQNWKMSNYGVLGMEWTPKVIDPNRTYSNIIITVSTSTESYNAVALYEEEIKPREGRLLLNEVLLNKHTNGGITIQMETETRIYHVERQGGDLVYDEYYLDGSLGRTAYITFSASVKDFYKYENKIRALVEGIGKGEVPQG